MVIVSLNLCLCPVSLSEVDLDLFACLQSSGRDTMSPLRLG